MGVSTSRIEDDKALNLCQERKHFVRQAIDGRVALATAHVSYIQALRNTGVSIGKFLEAQMQAEPFLFTPTSATREPLSLNEKIHSHFSSSSPSMSYREDMIEPILPVTSTDSRQFELNYMRTSNSTSTVVEDKLPYIATATWKSISDNPSNLNENLSLEHSPLTEWDYFDLPTHDSNQFLHQYDELNSASDYGSKGYQFREECLPDLKKDAESNQGDKCCEDSDDGGSQHSEKLNHTRESDWSNHSPLVTSMVNNVHDDKQLNGKIDENKKTSSQVRIVHTEEKGRPNQEKDKTQEHTAKDSLSSIKEIEYLFFKASDFGKEVPRMLQESKVQFQPLFSEYKARSMKASYFLSTCFHSGDDSKEVPKEPLQDEIKYLPWHGSGSSQSSSSRSPLIYTSRDANEETSIDSFNRFCMNSGSHSSTLDRLYAWERKLYDEVKASWLIKKEYELKCKALREKESREQNWKQIDKARSIVKDLHLRIIVAIHRINSISKKIEELRDKELQPQIEELIERLSHMWQMMFDCHNLKYSIISEIRNNDSAKISAHTEHHREAVLLLESELSSFFSSIMKWMDSYKLYLQSINGWLNKCVCPVRQKSSRRNNPDFDPKRVGAPPIFTICREWIHAVDQLPTRDLTNSIKKLLSDTTCFLPPQDRTNGIRSESEITESHNQNLSAQILQSSLPEFLNQLKIFSESSMNMYKNLLASTKEAHDAYDHGPRRPMFYSRTT